MKNKSIMKNKFLCCLIGFILLSVPEETIAQEKSKYYALAGIQNMKFKNLNEKLKSKNLSQTENLHYYMGAGGNTDFGKIIVGGEGYLLYSDENKKGLYLTESSGGMGYIYGGYKIINRTNFYFYPRIGLGGGGMNVRISSEANQPLEEFLSSASSNKLSTGNLILHSGLKFGLELGEDFDFNFDITFTKSFSITR